MTAVVTAGVHMSDEQVRQLGQKLDDVLKRVTGLEQTVANLITCNKKHEKFLVWIRNAGWVLLGIGVGSGLIKIGSLTSLVASLQ